MEFVPPRLGEAVPILNASPHVAFTLPWQVRPPHDSLTVVVKATFALAPDGTCTLAEEPDPPSGDVRRDDLPAASLAYASDFAVFKPRADVTLVGTAHAPRPGATAARVDFTFGTSLKKSVAVIGDRAWTPAGLTPPAPFERVPLTYERAYGGPGYEPNPVGLGHKPDAGDLARARLPNLETLSALIRSPRDTPPPAALGPVAPDWGTRASRRGTYDARWFKTRWPYLPDDFDWGYFNHAPADQQVPYPSGSESFEIAGVLPGGALLAGRLPGARPRAFLQRTREAGAGFVEVPLALDTVHFDTDAGKLVLAWRGVTEVSDEDAPEVATVFVLDEAGGEPLTLEQAQERYRAEVLARMSAGEAEEPEPEEPDDAAGDAAATNPSLAQAIAESASRHAALAARAEAEAPPPPPAMTRDEVLALLAGPAAGEASDFTGCDLSGLDLRGRDFSGAVFAHANLAGVDLTEAKLAEAVFSSANLSGARLPGADLSGADLSDADLSGADLSGASLANALLSRARCDRAVFEGGSLGEAVFAECSLADANFDGAALEAAELLACRLPRASFRGAKLDNAKIYDSEGEAVCFDGASLADFRANGARIPRSTFVGALAPRSVWGGADLTECVMRDAVLAGANFVRAVLKRATLGGVRAREAVFRRARMAGAVLTKSDLMKSTFEAADLSGADLRGANLYQAEFWRAKLQGADWALAHVAGSKLADKD